MRCSSYRFYQQTSRFIAPLLSAKRESPTPILLLCSSTSFQSSSAGSSALSNALHTAGYGVAIVDMTEFYVGGGTKAVDAAVEALHDAIRSLGSGVPPVAIAHGIGASFAQAYLESYALSGLAMISPLTPDPRVTLSRWAPQTVKDSESNVLKKVATALFNASKNNSTSAVSSSILNNSPMAATTAAAAFALSLPRVLLEPSPVPILALRGRHDTWCDASDLEAVAAHHKLSEREACAIGGVAAADYDIGFSGSAEKAAAIKDTLMDWIVARF
jgi:pimeloyl-ACP methyl ester carboxylesterase